MWGAIIGDIIGSIYEYDQFKNTHRLEVEPIIKDECIYTDDTILTIAILDSYLNNKDYKQILIEYVNRFKDVKHPGFPNPFSKSFIDWANGCSKYGNESIGNGAMMRISSIPYLVDDYERMREEVIKATSTSHNTKEAIDCALIISDIIYSSLHGITREELIEKYNEYIYYKEFTRFNSTCYSTLNNCLYVLFNNDKYEDAIKEVLSYGGDTDTNSCIVGSMAEAMYGVPRELINQARVKLPDDFNSLLDKAYLRIKKDTQ